MSPLAADRLSAMLPFAGSGSLGCMRRIVAS